MLWLFYPQGNSLLTPTREKTVDLKMAQTRWRRKYLLLGTELWLCSPEPSNYSD
jgi:hypothetical protein